MYWFKPVAPLSTAAGMHRFVWDVRYSAPPVAQPGYSMFTVAGGDVPREPSGPQALPGGYQVRLTVDGKTYTQPFKLTMDPRVKTSLEDLRRQFMLEDNLAGLIRQATATIQQIHAAAQAGRISGEDEQKLFDPAGAALLANLSQLLVAVDSADAAPTKQQLDAATGLVMKMDSLHRKLQQLQLKSK